MKERYAVLRDTRKPLDLLRQCGGYYQCPKDADDKRLGPLVGYAGRDDSGRQYVGDVYANFAKLERHAPALQNVAGKLIERVRVPALVDRPVVEATGFCGAPEGGKALAVALAMIASGQYIFPEKKITVAASATSREVSELVFDRHEPEPETIWWIVEDVCNNFSTTAKLVKLIEDCGASVAGIICFLNRSLEVEDQFTVRDGLVLPVVALVRQPIMQWSQDHPDVAEDIKAGNIVWKPKNDWAKLEAAMVANS